jgi:hypothetical protein
MLGASHNWDHTEQHQGEESYQAHLEHGLHDPLMTRESQSQTQTHSQLSGLKNNRTQAAILPSHNVYWPDASLNG